MSLALSDNYKPDSRDNRVVETNAAFNGVIKKRLRTCNSLRLSIAPRFIEVLGVKDLDYDCFNSFDS